MRLMVSEYLARLPDRATNMFWGDAPLGDTSLTAGTPFLGSWHFVQLASVQRILHSARGSAMKHEASARIRPI